MEIKEANVDDVLNVIEVAKNTGKIRKGINEVTKSIERAQAKLVVVASDVSPAEIVLHLKPLCEEKSIAFVQQGSKQELGAAVGLRVGTGAIAVTEVGEAKKALQELTGGASEKAAEEGA